jgi:hypothetical protein
MTARYLMSDSHIFFTMILKLFASGMGNYFSKRLPAESKLLDS